MTRDIPYRARQPKKKLETEDAARSITAAQFPIPDGTPAFKEGYRECVNMYAMHAPNKRGVARILEEHCITLEDECLRMNMARDALAQYEGYRQAIKDLKRMKRIR